MNKRRLLNAALCFATLPASNAAFAQTEPPTIADNVSAAESGVEEIIVTAQKRSESAQDVPIAISAFSAETAELMGVRTSTDLTAAVPNLAMYPQNTSISPYIRGIGNKNTAAGDESAVAIYVDGVYMSSMAAGLISLNNIERIEILKGPQGSLFGRNATAGVIQIITKDPSHEPRFDLSLGYGNFDTFEASFYGSAGVAEGIATDLAVRVINQGDGWGRNIVTGNDIYKGRELSIRNKWKAELGETTVATLALDYNDAKPVAVPMFRALPGSLLVGGFGFVGFYNINANIDSDTRTKQWGASLTVEQDLNALSLVSITSYRDVDTRFTLDSDGTPLRFQDGLFIQPSDTITQEFQLLSPASDRFNWILGAFFLSDEAGYSPFTLRLANANVTRFTEQDTKSYAIFGQATANITEATNLTVGLRYTIDDRQISGYDLTAAGIRNQVKQDARFEDPTWRVALDHEFTDRILGYVSYGRGFKSGVFNTIAPATPAVRPEVLDTYEVGLKTDLFDRRLRFNAAAFINEFKDIQLQVPIVGGTALLNAAQADSRGFEADLEAVLTDDLVVRAGVAHTDSKYTNFPNAVIFTPRPGGGNIQTTGDARGAELIAAPNWTANLTIQYTARAASGDYTFSVTDYYNSGFFFDQQNRVRQPKYNLVNASIDWKAADERWGVRLWAKNLTDKRYYTNIVPQTFGDGSVPAAPRTYGATVRMSF